MYISISIYIYIYIICIYTYVCMAATPHSVDPLGRHTQGTEGRNLVDDHGTICAQKVQCASPEQRVRKSGEHRLSPVICELNGSDLGFIDAKMTLYRSVFRNLNLDLDERFPKRVYL